MRIGIVTQPLEMNYGGILQNWALQQALKSLGHEPVTIDAYERFSTPHYLFNCLRTAWMRYRGKKWMKYPDRYRGALRSETVGRFIEEHIDKTRVLWDYKRSVVRRYRMDALIVGSDQVWRQVYGGDHLEDMYLRFAAGLPIRRVAYAASFGIDHWDYTPEQTAACAALAQQMDAVSVREESGVAMCREHLGVDAQWVLDPTMLLEAEQYEPIIDKEWNDTEPYLAVYCLTINPEKEAFFQKLADDRGLKVVYFSSGWTSKVTVEQWLTMFKNASMVVTDSFHGTVFSILFGKDFYSLCTPHRGITRINSLLSRLGLAHRLVLDNTLTNASTHDIDWTAVHDRLEDLRRESFGFLRDALS